MAVPHLNLIIGEFGSGKSLRLLEIGLYTAEKYRKSLTTNFPINIPALKEYCRIKGYLWVLNLIRYKKVRFISLSNHHQLPKVIERRNTVVLVDECGIFLNARSWSRVPHDFLASLVQCRHDGIFIFFAAHFLEQIDKQVRENAQRIIVCRAATKYSHALRNDRILFRWWHEFKPDSFHRWEEKPQHRSNFFHTWLIANHNQLPTPVFPFRLHFKFSRLPRSFPFYQRLIHFLLNSCVYIRPSAVIQLFFCFDSWGRLDKPDHGRPRYLLSVPRKTYEDWSRSR